MRTTVPLPLFLLHDWNAEDFSARPVRTSTQREHPHQDQSCQEPISATKKKTLVMKVLTLPEGSICQ